ncbi:MAG: hypothetical protein IJ574_01030 [Bacilli bacterium]|nr:hypothetical protein [Bacilli bacterium]
MKRSIRNIIASVLILGSVVGGYFTYNSAKDSISVSSDTNMMSGQKMNRPDNMPTDSETSDSKSSSQTPPEKPSDDTTTNDSSASNSKREKRSKNSTSSENGEESSTNEPPAKPDGDNTEMATPPSDGQIPNDGGMTPPDMNNNSTETNNELSTTYYVLYGVEGLILSISLIYLLMSKFGKKSLKETYNSADKIIICVLGTIIITVGLTAGLVAITKNVDNTDTDYNVVNGSNNNISSSATGNVVIDNEEKELNDTYEATSEDESAIVVKNGGNLSMSNATVNKSSGDTSNTENSEFYGINSGILVTSNSTATIKNTKITTNTKGSNAVFATGENAKIYISDTTIKTTGSSSSRGLDATYGGYIEADNVDITTQGGSCATLATDRGEGTVKVSNSKLETNGSGSPVIYSTGNISITKTSGVANGSQMVVIEGKNSATVTDSDLTASGKGNRGDVDHAGIMIYQSMSGDASEGTGTFTAANSSLSIDSSSSYYKTAPMFFITNTDAVINLENTKLSYGSNILISAKGTSEWGNSGSNGGNVTLNATKQTLNGNIEIDNISTLTMNLTSSTYKGTINADNSAKSITLKLDKDSKITLTGDSYITSLEDSDSTYSNIDFNGYKLYVNGKAIN